MKQYTTSSDMETIALGKELAKTLKKGSVVLLYGELGAGKTTLVKGLAQGFGVAVEITSPTFTLMNIYPADGTRGIEFLCHIDTYRLRSYNEFVGVGALDYVGNLSAVSVIEWPEKVADVMANIPSHTLVHIRLKMLEEGGRAIEIEEEIIL